MASRQLKEAELRSPDGEPVAYFRGRKLKGKEVRVPTGYRGVAVKKNSEEGRDAVEDRRRRRRNEYTNEYGDEVGEEEEEEQVAVLEEVAAFEEVVVWDHEKVVEDDDGIVKGLAEWIRFAEAVSLVFKNHCVIRAVQYMNADPPDFGWAMIDAYEEKY